jgi:thiol-disulfide isomerase/thioredoxin
MANARTDSSEAPEKTGSAFAQLAQLAFIAVASVGVFSFVKAARADHRIAACSAMCAYRPTYAGMNRTAPDFELSDLSGKKVKFSSFFDKKKPVVLSFWTKTCKPCLEEMPSLASLAEIVKKDGIRVVTVSTDEGPEAVRDHLQVVLEGKAPPFEVLFDPEAEIVSGKFGTSLFPETWLLDGDRVIRARIDGARDWTSPFALELLTMIGRPGGCPVEFQRGLPAGPFKGLCEDE